MRNTAFTARRKLAARLTFCFLRERSPEHYATCAKSYPDTHSVSPCLIQRGKEEYKLAATSDGKADKSGKKKKGQKDMDDLKKEVDLVSKRRQALLWRSATGGNGVKPSDLPGLYSHCSRHT